MGESEEFLNERLITWDCSRGASRNRAGGIARWPRAGKSPTGECVNSNGGHASQWLGVQQSTIVFSPAVLRE